MNTSVSYSYAINHSNYHFVSFTRPMSTLIFIEWKKKNFMIVSITVNQLDKAKKSIEWYRAGYQIEEEYEAVRKFASDSKSETFYEKIVKFREPALMRALILVIVLWTFMQICGFNSILFYMEIILKQAKTNVIEPKVLVVYVSTSAVVASFLSIVLIDRCGRWFYD